MNLAALLCDTPDGSVALIDGSSRVTYGELRDHVSRTAGGLRAAGVGPGDRIVVLAGNETPFVVALLAVWHVGAAAVLVNHLEPVPQLVQYLSGIDPAGILVGSTTQALDAGTALAAEGFADRLFATPHGVDSPDVPAASAEPIALVDCAPGDPALYIFTSGVSGLPRPAMLTHGNLAATHDALAARPETAQSSASVSLGALPLVHILGLNVAVLSTLRNGGTTVLQSHWNAEQAVALVDDHNIDTLVLVPTMWSDLASATHGDASAFSKVRLARCGAATLTPQVATRVHDELGIELAQGYGLTETAGTVTFEPHARMRPGSVGTALNHVDIRIIDDGVDAEPGDPGEIWIKGACVFGGYYGSPELNEDLFSPDGYYRTGDIGVFDDRLYLVGRQKDMISVSGFKISPVEVELTLEAHPSVSGSLVIGEPDDRTGERVVAYVIPEKGMTVEPTDLQGHVREALARYKVPKNIYLVEDLPANIIGKKMRRSFRPV